MIMKKIKEFFKKCSKHRPKYRIVYVENDFNFGNYYKIQSKYLLGYQTYYFRVPNSAFFDQTEFRFKTFEAAKEELNLLLQGKSKYNCFQEVVYDTSKQE
jgi:hypothetical protein